MQIIIMMTIDEEEEEDVYTCKEGLAVLKTEGEINRVQRVKKEVTLNTHHMCSTSGIFKWVKVRAVVKSNKVHLLTELKSKVTYKKEIQCD